MNIVRGWEPEKHMAGEELKAPYRVASAYESLIGKFQGAVEGAGKTFNRLTRPVLNGFTQGGDADSAEFSECLYLKNWPCRKLSAGKRLDVVVKILETLARSDWSLTKSTVYVNYFVITGGQAELVQSLHYDFVHDGQPDHPYFHVQLSDEMLQEEDLRSVGFTEMLKPNPLPNHCWVTSKIPTPDMTMASVLYCLVASHCGEGMFREFAKEILPVQERLPSPQFEALKRSLEKSMTHFKSSHWFAHMGGGME